MALSDLLFRKQKLVEENLAEYLEHWKECLECFRLGMDAYLAEGPGEQIDFYYSRVHKEESRGDDLRRAIETELYEKALLPEARGDILRILEALDKVMNRTESTLRQLVIERLETEPWMVPNLRRLTETTHDACLDLHKAALHLLRGEDDPVRALVQKVDEAESRCDHLEEDLLGRLFAGDLELARKLQLKDFVRRLSTVSDIAESASDRLHIVSIKRRV